MNKERLMKVLLSPLVSEKSTLMADASRHFAFKVAPDATKPEIKAAVKELYNIECEKVNTLITPRGLKKSYVRLSKDHDALDVANRVGVI